MLPIMIPPTPLPDPSSPIVIAINANLPTTTLLLRKEDATAVPFYSQFRDISSPRWQKVGCGIASLAMIISYYDPKLALDVDDLLSDGIASGAYLSSAGWTHSGLIRLARGYGLDGESRDLSALSRTRAYAALVAATKNGPVMASVHYRFDPKSTIPHLVVVDRIADGYVYFNDPAASGGDKRISEARFLRAWKARYIEIRPSANVGLSLAR